MKYLIFLVAFVYWQLPGDTTTTLTVNITDIDQAGTGTIYVMLWDQNDGFPKEVNKAKYRGVVKQFKGSAQHVFQDIPQGTYALSVYQDKNDNGEMDTNFIGIPKEPIAAYNVNGLSRPNFKKSSLVLNEDQQEVTLKMLND